MERQTKALERMVETVDIIHDQLLAVKEMLQGKERAASEQGSSSDHAEE